MRSTKLLTSANHVVTISNHSIDTIVNLTRMLSWYHLDINISIDAPIEEIEKILIRELPEIGKRYYGIVGELQYKGIRSFGTAGTELTKPAITIRISAKCSEKDLSDVRVFVNREALLLLRQEGIEIQ